MLATKEADLQLLALKIILLLIRNSGWLPIPPLPLPTQMLSKSNQSTLHSRKCEGGERRRRYHHALHTCGQSLSHPFTSSQEGCWDIECHQSQVINKINIYCLIQQLSNSTHHPLPGLANQSRKAVPATKFNYIWIQHWYINTIYLRPERLSGAKFLFWLKRQNWLKQGTDEQKLSSTGNQTSWTSCFLSSQTLSFLKWLKEIKWIFPYLAYLKTA